MTNTQLYLVQLGCYGIAVLCLMSGQWAAIPLCFVVVALIRAVMVMRQQIEYLLQRDALRQHFNGVGIDLKQVPHVKEL
jgi:hypothetical protein